MRITVITSQLIAEFETTKWQFFLDNILHWPALIKGLDQRSKLKILEIESSPLAF